jgi:hypothetical protein
VTELHLFLHISNRQSGPRRYKAFRMIMVTIVVVSVIVVVIGFYAFPSFAAPPAIPVKLPITITTTLTTTIASRTAYFTAILSNSSCSNSHSPTFRVAQFTENPFPGMSGRMLPANSFGPFRHEEVSASV